MSLEAPTALIIGIDNFVAIKLAGEILNKNISVVGVGEYSGELCSNKNFEIIYDDEGSTLGSTRTFDYVFDFGCGEEVWKNEKIIGEKWTMVNVGRKISDVRSQVSDIRRENTNWRVINAFGVYGVGMPEGENNTAFLTEVIRQAVLNQNLKLPDPKTLLRFLSVDDLVEVILRASFMSGTEGENFVVAGDEISCEELARVLIDEAKMTRFKVIQTDMELPVYDDNEILESRKKLRWEPKISFKDGIKEVLQYFFCKIDEEKRRKSSSSLSSSSSRKIEKKNKTHSSPILSEGPPLKKEVLKSEKKYEVVVEEEESSSSLSSSSSQKIEEKEGRVEEEVQNPPPAAAGTSLEKGGLNSQKIEKVKKEVEEIKEVEEEEEEEESSSSLSSSSSRKIEKKKKRNWFVSRWMIIGLVVVLILIVPINWAMVTYGAVRNIRAVEGLMLNKKYDEAEKLTTRSLEKTKAVDEKIDDLGLNKWKFFRNYQSMLRVMGDVMDFEKKGILALKRGENLGGAIFEEKTVVWGDEITKTKNDLKELKNEAGILQARLGGDWSWLPARFKSEPQKGIRKLDELTKFIDLSAKVLDVLPEFIGTDSKRREYLVLLQNENELRPGGGFIGSYGILSFNNGKLINFEVKDIYEADGQLKGHVEPPVEIKNYLGEAGWFMRDANWNASFPAVSTDIQWFFDKETGRKVDGVIGINLAVVKSILGVVGEIYVPDFKEKINKDNLFEQAEFYAETKFFPGSNQKASFLGGLGKLLFEEIKGLKIDKRLDLLKATIDLLEKNEIQVSLNEKKTAKLVADLGWDGAIYSGKCTGENCFADYLYLVEANLGVNKANYFLYRNIEQTVDISEYSISKVVKINYENTSKNSNWPGGDYKNYLRVYVPASANLAEVSVVDGNNPSSKKIYTGDELKIREVDGKKEIGFLVEVPASRKKIVEIRFLNEINLSNKDKFSYLYYIQKQSGFGDTGLVTLVSFPERWQPVQVQPMASLAGGKLLFNQKLDRDVKMGVEIGK